MRRCRRSISAIAFRGIAFGATFMFVANVAHAVQAQGDDWKIAIGPGVYVFPKFPGSSQLQVLPIPAQDISWRDRVFSQGPDVLGVNALHGENYHLGMSVSLDFQSRNSSDDARLKGLPNVHYGPKLRLFGDYTWWAFTASAAIYQDVAGTGQGLTAMGDLYVSAPVGKLLVSIGPGLTWANATYTARSLVSQRSKVPRPDSPNTTPPRRCEMSISI
jgi:MipA family protein